MLQIIWMICKIILLVILILLGLILTILLIVLFVPVRYKINAAYSDELELDGTVSWLFHIIHVRARMNGDKKQYKLRLFGKTIYDSLWPESRRKKRKKHNDGYKVKAAKAEKKAANKANKKIDKITNVNNETNKNDVTDENNTTNENNTTTGKTENDLLQNSKVSSSDYILEHNNNLDGTEQDIINNSATLYDEYDIIREEEAKNSDGEGHAKNKKGLSKLLTKITAKLKAFFAKVLSVIRKIKEKIINIFKSLANIKRKLKLIKEFIRDEVNKEGLRVVFGSAKKLIKHILPKRFRANVVFGTGDPCSTGQALGVAGLLYGIYGDNVHITPDFENKVIEGDLYAKGRIRLVTVLIIVIKLIFDKRFKRLKKNAITLKEAL